MRILSPCHASLYCNMFLWPHPSCWLLNLTSSAHSAPPPPPYSAISLLPLPLSLLAHPPSSLSLPFPSSLSSPVLPPLSPCSPSFFFTSSLLCLFLLSILSSPLSHTPSYFFPFLSLSSLNFLLSVILSPLSLFSLSPTLSIPLSLSTIVYIFSLSHPLYLFSLPLPPPPPPLSLSLSVVSLY